MKHMVCNFFQETLQDNNRLQILHCVHGLLISFLRSCLVESSVIVRFYLIIWMCNTVIN